MVVIAFNTLFYYELNFFRQCFFLLKDMIWRDHAFNYGIHWEGGGGFFDVCGFGNFWGNIEILDFFYFENF